MRLPFDPTGFRARSGDGDGWVRCAQGHRHWGRFGAAGLLVRDRADGRDRVVLQHRAAWSHQGNTWGLPGGARDSHESAVDAALREASEEAGLDPARVRPTGLLCDDHGGWSYVSVLAEPVGPSGPAGGAVSSEAPATGSSPGPGGLAPRATGGESTEVRWVEVAEVDELPLHPGFATTWPRLRTAGAGLAIIVDAANVIGARGRGDGWWRDRAGAAARLRDALVPLAAAGLPVGGLPSGLDYAGLDILLPRLVLVVEGAARALADSATDGPVAVVPAAGAGDDAIVAAAAASAAARATLVITADRELRTRVSSVGATVAGPGWLLAQLDGVPGPTG